MIDHLEDHEKKLFSALWGPSFAREKITRQQIEQIRKLAANIHTRRLEYLYADPDVSVTSRR